MADKKRLLTDEEINGRNARGVAKAQDAKTASIKDAEFVERIDSHTARLIDIFERDAGRDCQQRIEALIEGIKEVFHNLPTYEEFKTAYGNRPKDIIYASALGMVLGEIIALKATHTNKSGTIDK